MDIFYFAWFLQDLHIDLLDKLRIIYETRGKAKEYAPLGIELYADCSYGCKYCFVLKKLNVNVEKLRKNNGPVKDEYQREYPKG